MKRLTPLIFILLILTGCANHGPNPAVCDGQHRRPANPYGSVLPSLPDRPYAMPGVGAPSPPTGPLSGLLPRSQIDPASLYACGDRA